MNLGDYPYLFTVTDRFSITDRGVVLAPGVPRDRAPVVRVGDPLILRTPLGEVISTSVRSLERLNYRGREIPLNPTSPVLLPADFHKFDIPLGTEVFLGKLLVENTVEPELGRSRV